MDIEINKPVWIYWKDADTSSGWTNYTPEDSNKVDLLPTLGFLTHITDEWAYVGLYADKPSNSKLCELRIPRENIRFISPIAQPRKPKGMTVAEYLEKLNG